MWPESQEHNEESHDVRKFLANLLIGSNPKMHVEFSTKTDLKRMPEIL
jgi:hypothetical protein